MFEFYDDMHEIDWGNQLCFYMYKTRKEHKTSIRSMKS